MPPESAARRRTDSRRVAAGPSPASSATSASSDRPVGLSAGRPGPLGGPERRLFGEPVWTTTHGGYTLALGNNETYYREVLDGPPGRVWTGHDQWLWWDSVNRATAGMTEPQADRFLRDMVISLASEQPVTFLRAMLDRWLRFWSVAPAEAVYSRSIRLATAIWTIPLWIVLVLGLCRRSLWRWPRVAAPLLILGLTLVHALYWTDLRMRAPIVPAIALIAASAVWPFGSRTASNVCMSLGIHAAPRPTKEGPSPRGRAWCRGFLVQD